jgi:hypothetical protein
MKGWFAVARGITAHHLFRGNPERLAVWLWLLDNAAWKDTTHDVSGRTIQVPRGSVCASTRHIAEAVGVGHQVVRTALKRFQTEHMINTAATHGKTLITLRNYCKYQDHGSGTNTAPNTALTQQQHSANTQKEQGNKGTSKEEAKASLSSGDDAKAETERAVAMFNDTAGAQGWPQVRVLSKQRLSALKGRLREVGGLDGWQDALARAAASDHLNGKNDRGWTCNFDFLTRQSSFAKLMEGNYDNRQPTTRRSKGDERLAAAMRAAERFDREKELRLAGGTDYDASQPLLHPGHPRRAIGGGDG